MDKIEYFKEISRLTSDLGVAITFMIVFLFIFLIFSIVLSVQLPKIINNYLSKKNEQRERELERDKERWDKHVDLTEQGWRVIGQNDELLFPCTLTQAVTRMFEELKYSQTLIPLKTGIN